MADTRGVLLDIDGTLVDSTYHHAMAWFRAFSRHDVIVPVYRIHRAIGMGGDRLVAHVAGDDVEQRLGDDVRDAWSEEYAAVVDQVPALPGAADLVRHLAGQGFRIGLASSGEPEFSKHAAKTVGIEDLVDVLTTSADADQSKPEPDILGAALERLEVSRAVVVGDTPYDVEAAARAGLSCLAVLTGGFGREELESAGAAVVAADPSELLDVDWESHLRSPRGV